MKKMIVLICSMLTTGLFAQTTDLESALKTRNTEVTEGWKKGGTVALNLSQVSLTNWAAGGENSFSANGLINFFIHYKKDKNLWENYFEAGFGTLKQGREESWLKTDDKLDITSKYGRNAFSDWYYSALLNFKTQFAPGYNYPDDSTKISDFLTPGYLLGAVGMDYKPGDNFTAFITPVTVKMTIVQNQKLADAGAFGVDPAVYNSNGAKTQDGKNLRSELGGYIRLFYQRDLMENIALQTKLDLFSNYLEEPQNVDISWEVLISMKVNKYFSATVSTHLLYDDNIAIATDTNNDGIPDASGPRTQFKEVIGVGFSYKF